MYFSSAQSNRGRSHYIVREYRDVIEDDGSIKRQRVQTKVCFGQTSSEGTGLPLLSLSDGEDDPGDIYDFELDYSEVDTGAPSGSSTEHQKRKQSNVKHWQEIRPKLVRVSLKTEGFLHSQLDAICMKCEQQSANYRCLDCGGAALSVCKSCCDDLHSTENFLHCPEVYQDGTWRLYTLDQRHILNPFHDCTNGKEKKTMTVIDMKGRHHDVLIAFCQCESPMETLVSLRLWPATPCNPSLAFTWDLLTTLQSLLFECQVSVYDFVKHLNFYKCIFDKNRSIYKQLLESFEEFRWHCKAKESCTITGKDIIIKPDPFECPACPSESEQQFPSQIFLSADACFGLPRKKSRTMKYQEPLSRGMYFLPQDDVDAFMESYPKSSKNQDEDCSDFQAGSAIRSKGRYVALDETAVFGIACKHAFPWRFLNVKGGERIGYMVFMMTKLLECKDNIAPSKVNLMYDICCQLEKHLKKQGKMDLLEHFKLACPQFHAYAHSADCQIRYSPRRLAGWGLCDGEVMERLWSYLGRFKRMTKEMSSSHREDILNDALHFHSRHQKENIVFALLKSYEEALKRQKEANNALQDLKDMCSGMLSDEVMKQWQFEEMQIIANAQPQTVNLGEHGWVTQYVELLRNFYALREAVVLGEETEVSEKKLQRNVQELVKLEKGHGIKIRWKQSDQKFKSALIASEASKATTLLDAVRMSGRKRCFLLSLMKRYADGQKQAQRIIKAISKEGKILKEKLKKYNASVQVLIENGLDFNILSWEQASDVTTGIYKHSSASPLQAWKRDAIEAYTLLQRAGEEISIIHSEMHSVILNAYKDCRSCDAATAICGHAGSLTSIQAGLLSIAKVRQSHQHMHLQFAVQSLSKHVDISREIYNYMANIQQLPPPCEAEEDALQSDEEEDFQDSQENIPNDISKYYLFDDVGSDSGLGTEC